MDTLTWEALWGILSNGLPQGVAGMAHFTIGKGGNIYGTE